MESDVDYRLITNSAEDDLRTYLTPTNDQTSALLRQKYRGPEANRGLGGSKAPPSLFVISQVFLLQTLILKFDDNVAKSMQRCNLVNLFMLMSLSITFQGSSGCPRGKCATMRRSAWVTIAASSCPSAVWTAMSRGMPGAVHSRHETCHRKQ